MPEMFDVNDQENTFLVMPFNIGAVKVVNISTYHHILEKPAVLSFKLEYYAASLLLFLGFKIQIGRKLKVKYASHLK